MKQDKCVILSGGTDWCYYSWRGYLKSHPEIKFVRDGIPVRNNKILKWVWAKLFSPRRNAGFRFFKKFWYYSILDNLGLRENDRLIFITYDWNMLTTDLDFYKWLKKKSPKVVLVYMFTNIMKYTGSTKYGILHQLKGTFDYVFAFDKEDAVKYGFLYSPLVYTSNDDVLAAKHNTDLFYVGRAKDRLPQLLAIFEQAQAEGLVCDFNIVDVPQEAQKYKETISYNKPLSYQEVLTRIKASKCLVDAIQGDSVGLTIKTCEAVVCKKKLITTNVHVKDEDFYSPSNIMVLKENEPISGLSSFVRGKYEETELGKTAAYLFSPDRLFNEIKKQEECHL